MTWVRIDDGFYQHPKVASAGPLAMAMQVAALCYCNKNLTDGFVPWSVAQSLLSWEFIGQADADNPERGSPLFKVGITCGMAGDDVTCQFVIDQLVANGLWDEADGGFRVHDYLDYQPSKAEILAVRKVRSKAGKASIRAKRKHSKDKDTQQDVEQDVNKMFNKNPTKGVGIGIGDFDPTTDRERQAQAIIGGWWQADMLAVRGKSVNPDPRAVVIAGEWAVGMAQADVKTAVNKLVRDDDPFVVKRGWTLAMLPERAPGYLTGLVGKSDADRAMEEA
jgi:hypothetical protein